MPALREGCRRRRRQSRSEHHSRERHAGKPQHFRRQGQAFVKAAVRAGCETHGALSKKSPSAPLRRFVGAVEAPMWPIVQMRGIR